MALSVGHGSAVVEVLPGEPMGGYADRVGGASDRGRPLEVHCLRLVDGDRGVALVVVDVVCVNVDLVERARGLALRHGLDDVVVCATHTHSGPETGCVPGGTATPEDVAERVLDAIDRALAAAAETRPASVSAHEVVVHDVGSVRAAPPAPDAALPVDIVVFERGGQPGVLVVCPVHPTVLPATNLDPDPDLVGAVRRLVGQEWRRRTGRALDFVVVATGAAGDISTRHHRRGRSTDMLELAARVAVPVVDSLLRRQPRDEASLSSTLGAVRCDAIALPRKSAATWRSLLDAPPGHDEGERARHTREQARRIVGEMGLDQHSGSIDVPVATITLGPAELVGIGGEPFLSVRTALRERVGGAIVIGYANGYCGYLPHPGPGPQPTYEELVTVVEPTAPRQLVELLHRRLSPGNPGTTSKETA